MVKIKGRLTYANLISTMALFLALGGAGALAASHLTVPRNSVGAKQLKNNSISAQKLKPEAISTPKLRTAAVGSEKIAPGAVNSSKLAAASVGTGQLADASVTAAKLDPSQRSEAIAFSAATPFDLIDSYDPATWTTVMSVNLPEGSWVLDADVGLFVATNVPSHVACRMSENGAVLAQGGAEAEEEAASVPSIEGISLSATGTAGAVVVNCGDDRNGTQALTRSLIARRVGSVGAG
jgi:hypothetical protein